jgi:5-methyltetrahydrofolate--homocysteine methyltransferase
MVWSFEDIVYELNYESAKIAREVADAFTAKNRISPDLLRVP